MFIDENSVIINGISMGQYLLQVEYGYNKLWGPDTGRNLKAKMSGEEDIIKAKGKNLDCFYAFHFIFILYVPNP